jgi:UDP-GlcNAc:undecaprenyl-phosphate GlcNAc-1-phosphate transferase
MLNSTILLSLLSLIISLISIPVIIKISHHYNLLDSTNHRKIHITDTSRLGGVGVFLAFFPIACYVIITGSNGYNPFYLIAGMTIAFLCGFIDDLVRIRARYKLLIQIAAASMIVLSGLLIKDLRIYTFFYINFGFLSYPITVFWIVAFMNAVNLIDGMDGLSTGIVLIANFFVILISLILGNYHVLTLAVMLECAILGFYIYNFPPAKIFLGDGGAYFIGFMYAVFPLMGVKKSAALTVFLIPMILLLVPICDVILVIFNRFKNGQNLFKPDKSHLHHRLMNLGFTTKGILAVVYSYTAILGIFSLLMVAVHSKFTMFLLTFILLMLGISFYMLNRAEIVISNLKQENQSSKDLLRKNLDNIRIFRKIS